MLQSRCTDMDSKDARTFRESFQHLFEKSCWKSGRLEEWGKDDTYKATVAAAFSGEQLYMIVYVLEQRTPDAVELFNRKMVLDRASQLDWKNCSKFSGYSYTTQPRRQAIWHSSRYVNELATLLCPQERREEEKGSVDLIRHYYRQVPRA